MRFPAMPVDRAGLRDPRQVRGASASCRSAIPPIMPDIPNPDSRRCRHQVGTDRALPQAARQRLRLRLLRRARPAARRQSIAYFGPDVRIPVPQPALNVNMDAHTNVESLSFSLDGTREEDRRDDDHRPGDAARSPIPIPMPNVSVLRPPLGVRPTPPAKVEFPDDVAHMQSGRGGAARRSASSFGAPDAITGRGTLDVLRYGHVLRSRHAGRRARRRPRLRRPVLRQQRHPQHQARRVQAELQLSPRRADLQHAGGAAMSDRDPHAAASSTASTAARSRNNVDPMLSGRIQVHRAGRRRPGARRPGRCPACRSPASPWASSRCRRSAPASGSSSSTAIPSKPIWVGCCWGLGAPTCRCCRASSRPRCPASSCRRTLKNGIVISDLPGPTGGIMLKSTTGAMIIVNDIGIIIIERQGRGDHHGRAVDPDDRRADRHECCRADGRSDARPGPPPRRNGAVRTRRASRAEGAGAACARQRPAGGDDLSPYVVAGCTFASPPGPCVTRQWMVGSPRVFAMGLPVAIQSGAGLCAPNGAPLVSRRRAAARPRHLRCTP